jgi:SHS2 domain-containing protein
MMRTYFPSGFSFDLEKSRSERWAESWRLNGERQRMQPFRVLEHTADIGFEAFGATRKEVFANAARALMYLMVDPESIVPREKLPLRTEASDMPNLLVNWLSEILYLFDAEGWLFRDFEVEDLTDRSLEAMARGEKFDRTRHQVKLLVKAITYHQLDLRETAQRWRAQVYVDI